MPNIDTLSIQFNANGTEKAIKNIKSMGYAVRNLAQSVKSIDANKLSAFTSSMETLKKSVPTEAQTNRMVAFSNAVKDLSAVIGSANIGGFSKDMATLGGAVETFKRSSVNSIQNAVTAMQNLGTATQQTASTISNVIPKKSQAISFTDSKGSVSASKEIVASLDKVQIKAKGVTGILQKMGIYTPTKAFKTLEESAEKVRQKYEQLRSTIQKGLNEGSITSGDSTYKKKMAELDALRNKYDELILKQRELAQAGDAFKVNPTWERSISAFKSGFSSVTGIVKGGLLAAMKGVNNHVKSFTSRIREAGSALKKTVSGGNNATKMAKKFANELLRVSKMLKLMITRMALRKVIAEVGNGFKSLAIHSDEFNNSVSGMMNGAKKLGYSFAALVSPLINALAPAIIYVINLLTKLANAIQQVFGALTGATTWNKAKDFTESWADNIEAANKGAKELKKTVLGFDELNQLQEKTSGGGGNDITDMFETMPIDQRWKDIADWMKQMWQIGDFAELGTKIGKKLQQMLRSIPWNEIRKTSNKLGRSLATLINGFVEVEKLGYDIGKTIAQSINTVFEFINGFVHKLHWKSIGKFIADTFNGFFEGIDWKLIKDTVVTGLTGLAKSIQTFINRFHWDNISNFIINAVDTIVKGVRGFVENIDWADLGKKLGDQLRKIVQGIDWNDLGKAIGDVVQSSIDVFTGLIDGLDVDATVTALTEMVKGFFEKVDTAQAGENIGKLMQKLIDIIKGFWAENKETLVTELGQFIGGIFSELNAEDLGGILGGIFVIALSFGVAKLALAIGSETIKQVIAKKIAGTITEVAANEAITTASTAMGTSIASTVFWGVTEFLAVHSLANEFSKSLFPNDKELYDEYSGFTGFFKEVKDVAIGEWDMFVMLVDSLTKDHVEPLTEEQKKKLQELKDNAAQASGAYKESIDEVIKVTDEAREKLKSTGLDESSELYKNLAKDMSSTADQAKKTADEVRNTATAYKGPTDAIAAMKKAAEEGSKANDDFKVSLDKTAETTAKVKESVSSISDSTSKASEDFKEFSRALSTDFGTSSDEISKNAKELQADLQKSFDELLQSGDDLSAGAETNISDIVGYVDQGTDDLVKDFDVIKESMTKEKWTFDGVAEGLTETFRKAKEGIKGQWNQIANTLNGEHSVASEKIKINLPKFATGGFPEDGLFLASHHELVGSFSNGKTAVANNQQIIAGIETGVYSAVSKAMSQNNGGSQYIANEIIVDGDVIARTVSKAQDRQNRRFSPATT